MDAIPQSISLEDFPVSTGDNHAGSNFVVDQSLQSVVCAFCQRVLSADIRAIGSLETISICGDCKFLFLEDISTPTHESHGRRIPRRRTRYSSSESIDSLFSQQFSHIINLARQNQSRVSGLEDLPAQVDVETRLLQRTSSRTTPRGSRRWRQVLSDTESDGLDNVDSLYAESDSNISFSQYRVSHGESDNISFSSYGGDSDASVDFRGFLDSEMFTQPNESSDFESDSDIDPMHAGLSQWNSDDQEEVNDIDGESEDGGSEEDDAEENTIESTEARVQFQNLLFSATSGSNYTANWQPHAGSPESEGMIWLRIRQNRQTYGRSILTNLEESELSPYVGNPGDYLDGRGFEELLQHLAETDNSRRVAPPAAASFLNRLPRVIINEEHVKHDGLACAICKDLLPIGTEVNQLPCNHLYHPFCILPWLSSRNSCPLCRFELPTDDKDYEDGKLNVRNGIEIHNTQQNMSEYSSSRTSDRDEEDEEHEVHRARLEQREILNALPASNSSGRENSRGRWFFLATAPIVSLMGIVLVLWLGNPLPERAQRQFHIPGPLPNQRENRRRWWSLF